MQQRLLLMLKGFLMGTADVVPGVSGGTVALVVGIYERLILAIRHIDIRLLGALLLPRFYRRALAWVLGRTPEENPLDPVDARADSVAFLVVLLTGLATALITGARIIPALLESEPESMRALFFGLVLASVAIPWQRIRARSAVHVAIGLAIATATYALVGLPKDSSGFARGSVDIVRDGAVGDVVVRAGTRVGAEPGSDKYAVRYVLLDDARLEASSAKTSVPVISTRAGINANAPAQRVRYFADNQDLASGIAVMQPAALEGGQDPSLAYIFACGAIAICAMILPGISGAFLLLLLGQYGYVLFQLHLALAERTMGAITVVGVFIAGIAVGILSFTRLLHWLLAHAHDVTMAALMGLMLGSLRMLWPYQRATPDGSVNVLPSEVGGSLGIPLIAFLVGFALVAGLEWLGRRHAHSGS